MPVPALLKLSFLRGRREW